MTDKGRITPRVDKLLSVVGGTAGLENLARTLERELAAITAERDALRELRQYLRHKLGKTPCCKWDVELGILRSEWPCSCGLDAILARLDGKEGT